MPNGRWLPGFCARLEVESALAIVTVKTSSLLPPRLNPWWLPSQHCSLNYASSNGGHLKQCVVHSVGELSDLIGSYGTDVLFRGQTSHYGNPGAPSIITSFDRSLCVWGFHDHPDTQSTDIRTLIPQASGHRFHGHPDTFRQAATQDYSLRSTSFFEAKRSSWSVYPCVKSERYYA